ncbi:MAG: hypothetical protein EDM05_050190 [Leptolyngbya sp. IPPAS B-1204]|uniref:Uncharacterized protein n=1 Tax=Leptolyngbya sp. NK1-12 TaxID=2547451 RepID=A0AA96WE63_9CYAN|nr:hypothetical protein [Leptolyngbya sp. NK1-12]MBF2048941.1 hypothetical protein [Elainella sp. C42_A2020_010]RNJ66342.1 MAG: hypothetical protein EDM05_26435 [Leptolyngbya sp. IPPAS B-1204]WNZ23663.1 hypothetical protein HJG54_12895 [Leptolyngbya sp. NK1-12]
MSLSSARFSETNLRIKLPKPDLRNITVLTRKLPNIPILPWNHYDSPWLESDDKLVEDQTPAEEPTDD